MSMKLFEMKQERTAVLEKAEALVSAVERGSRDFTDAEKTAYEGHMANAKRLGMKIETIQAKNTLAGKVNGSGFFDYAAAHPAEGLGPGAFGQPVASTINLAETLTPEYMAGLHAFLRTGGKAHAGELTAGADGTGGYHIPGSEAFTRQRLANGSFRGMNAATYEGTNGGSDAAGGYAISVPTWQQIVPLALRSSSFSVMLRRNSCPCTIRPPSALDWKAP